MDRFLIKKEYCYHGERNLLITIFMMQGLHVFCVWRILFPKFLIYSATLAISDQNLILLVFIDIMLILKVHDLKQGKGHIFMVRQVSPFCISISNSQGTRKFV